MTILIAGLVIFFGIHLLPSIPALRRKLVLKTGIHKYRGIYSLVSFIGLGLIIYGKSIVNFQPVYNPPGWGNSVAIIFMSPVFILLAASNMPGNIKRYMRHPMLTGVFIWSACHLLASGDLASLVLFGSFGLFSIFDIISANMRGAELQKTVYPVRKDIMIIMAGLAAYLSFLLLHEFLFGVAVI